MYSADTFTQIIAIVMDNASNNNTLMASLKSQCQRRGIDFPAQNARMRCMPHTIHLAAIKVQPFMILGKRHSDLIVSLAPGGNRSAVKN